MYRDELRRLLGRLMRVLRMERRLTLEESYQLLRLSEAIIDYGRMVQAHHGHSAPYVIVEIPELTLHFRETTEAIKDALRLLREMGRAEPFRVRGCWKVQLTDPLLSGHKMPWQGYEELCLDAEGNRGRHQ
jgi:hypothetical protein